MKNRTIKSQLPVLDRLSTEKTIRFVKQQFKKHLCDALSLHQVSAPAIVWQGTGINDDLNGVERAVRFPVKDQKEKIAEVVHSLAKWKRIRLMEYGIKTGEGILTDMRALRPDEVLSPIHSISVDQFDWECCIRPEDRNMEFLKTTVSKIYNALLLTESDLAVSYAIYTAWLPREIHFFYAEELLQKYPDKSPKEREHEIAKQYGAVFIMGIGAKLSDGKKHDGRAADYDDWSTQKDSDYQGLNGDIVLWNPILKASFELSSMGIRVDKTALMRQLELENCQDRSALKFHQLLLNDRLPLSIGGGIGQSRLAMLLLQKRHIGEVQVSLWSEDIREKASKDGVSLL